jgi:uracil-DNA glycosylase family 4
MPNAQIASKIPSTPFKGPTRDTLYDQFRGHAQDLGLDVQVFSDGPINATVAIIGEGPGDTEVRRGLPFVGGAGHLLWDSLRPTGLHRANTYVTNVVKRQISLSRRGNERNIVHRDELKKWMGLLEWELEQLPNVKTIFILGNYALEAILGEIGITNWRGSVVDCRINSRVAGKAVITINPAYAQRELKFEPIFRMDCLRLKAVVEGTYKPYEIEHLINPTYKEALKFIDDLKKAKKPTSVDIEVMNMETACIGLANDPHRGMCINWRGITENVYSTREEYNILSALHDLGVSHNRNKVPIIGQNSQFDQYWLGIKDWLPMPFTDDTLLMHHTLYPQLPHGLAFLCSQYTTHPFYKDDIDKWREGGDIDTFWRYNVKDACITLRCFQRMQVELEKQGLLKFYRSHVTRAMPHLIDATIQGIAVDKERKADIVEAVSTELQALKNRFQEMIVDLLGDEEYEPNPNSHVQMRELYFYRLGLKGRGQTTDKDNRNHMLKEPTNSTAAKEMLVQVGLIQKESKFLGTYAESKESPEDGRFRCQYNQFGTTSAPGRLSSSGLLDGTGSNMQNQPERAKEMFIADPGTQFFYFDMAQAEARIVAWRAQIEKWMEQFEQARKDGVYDCHRALAADMYKLPYDQVPKDDWDEDKHPTIRWIAKRCRHGLNYRMERHRLSEVTGLPYSVAQKNFILYHSVTPELRVWWDTEERNFKRDRQVFNALGRRHRVIQRIDEEALKSIVAFYPQSTLGDKVVQVWYQAQEDDDWPSDARIAINVHDNLVGMAPPKSAKKALSICIKYAQQAIMVEPVMRNGRPIIGTAKPVPLIIPADGKLSYPVSWQKETDKKSKNFGKMAWKPDPKGTHRWSHLEKVKL